MKNKMTWLLISHQLVHVRKICDQVHFMEQGNVLVSGTPEEILLHPSHPVHPPISGGYGGFIS